ncbi:electron transfer flavoprotein subunit beta/FixA family protein [Agromyces archimandritae]|uniref:Electron transfer flavoprotein subunit beta/FixA family protein n=1 Tax=Agromyces archimandritae TaxID=2781962 RepID=A0A975IMQ9_9MICO|nr:electron transfer flavoprotein subunit beta/FixA family protein [Agromyces archimandritae]QTX03787.1 electron transfer flavoprotein subunit beta/FixA family protein [Agromyces archimandritae]
MRILVLVKDVPDTYGARALHLETGLAEREAGERVIDEIDERALELALRHRDEHPGTEVVALAMGPAAAASSLRRALAMGAGRAVHVVDEALLGADLGLTAETLARAIDRIGAELVIAGDRSTDGGGGVVPAMIAEHLGIAQLTGLDSVEIGDGRVDGVRATEYGAVAAGAELPAIVSVTEKLPDARLASFKGIMAAKKQTIETLDLAELGIDADDHASARSIMIAVAPRPPRAAGVKIIDEGDAGERLAEFLAAERLA